MVDMTGDLDRLSSGVHPAVSKMGDRPPRPSIKKVIRLDDPDQPGGQLFAGKTIGDIGTWKWLRIAGFQSLGDVVNVTKIETVRVAEENEAARLRNTFSRDGFRLRQLKLNGELHGYIAMP